MNVALTLNLLNDGITESSAENFIKIRTFFAYLINRQSSKFNYLNDKLNLNRAESMLFLCNSHNSADQSKFFVLRMTLDIITSSMSNLCRYLNFSRQKEFSNHIELWLLQIERISRFFTILMERQQDRQGQTQERKFEIIKKKKKMLE